MTREIIRQIERDYWAEKADPIDMSEIFDLAQKALEQEPRWIPVSEKYPKPEDEYKLFLVTDDEGVISVQTFYMSIEKEPQPYFSGMVNVIAWMPLPKAYSEVEE